MIPLSRQNAEGAINALEQDHAPVVCLWHSPQGDPTAYRIGQAVIALRREDSAAVLVSR